MKSETELTRKLMPAFSFVMPLAEVLKHSDRATVGILDLSVSLGATAWLEIKAAESPDRIEHHLNWQRQLLAARRMQHATKLCWFVVYQEYEKFQRTLIVLPSAITESRHILSHVAVFEKFNHAAVAHFIYAELKAINHVYRR